MFVTDVFLDVACVFATVRTRYTLALLHIALAGKLDFIAIRTRIYFLARRLRISCFLPSLSVGLSVLLFLFGSKLVSAISLILSILSTFVFATMFFIIVSSHVVEIFTNTMWTLFACTLVAFVSP